MPPSQKTGERSHYEGNSENDDNDTIEFDVSDQLWIALAKFDHLFLAVGRGH